MTIELITEDGDVHTALTPYEGAKFVIVEGPCPLCLAGELHVKGRGIHTTTHDTMHAVAETLCCKREIGELRVTVSTIFGIEEDDRVLRGRCRVY